jgi:hypothetical protein
MLIVMMALAGLLAGKPVSRGTKIPPQAPLNDD